MRGGLDEVEVRGGGGEWMLTSVVPAAQNADEEEIGSRGGCRWWPRISRITRIGTADRLLRVSASLRTPR